VTLARASDLSEQGARRMLADLDEWRLVNQQRELDVG
jgi:DNA-binding IclR family transcriptional regulator